MSIGTLFSFCAGILIGLRLYYKHFYKQKKAEKNQILQDLWYGDSKLWLITQLPYCRKGEKNGPDC